MNKKSIGLLCVAAVLAGVTFYIVQPLFPNNKVATDPAVQTERTLAAVGALMMLPEGEQPTIFNVSDSATLKSQQGFFAGAENGDVLLVYAKSAKAIIYSPERNLIVNVGPITFDQNQK